MIILTSNLHIIGFFFVLLLASWTNNNDFIITAQCTVCADGITAPNGTFGGTTSCEFIEESIGMTPEDTIQCSEIRIQGFQMCNCPTIPEEYVSLCDYSTTGYTELPRMYDDLIIPGTTDNELTCSDVEFLLVEESNTMIQNSAWYCGCTNAERGSCYLCGDDTTIVPNDRLLPPRFTKTCNEFDREGGTVYDDTTECETFFNIDNINVQAYCGCSDDDDIESTCALCDGLNDDGSLVNPNLQVMDGLTCTDIDVVTGYVTSDEYCMTLQSDYGTACCQELTPTTTPPDNVPTASPTTASPVDDGTTISPTMTVETTSKPTEESDNVERSSSWVIHVTTAVGTTLSISFLMMP